VVTAEFDRHPADIFDDVEGRFTLLRADRVAEHATEQPYVGAQRITAEAGCRLIHRGFLASQILTSQILASQVGRNRSKGR